MFKRLFWLAVGAGFGFGVSLWAQRELRRLAERYTPERIASAFGEAGRDLASDLRSTLLERRQASRRPATARRWGALEAEEQASRAAS